MSIHTRKLASGNTAYIVAWREPGGRQRRKSFTTKTAAQKHERQTLAARDRGEWIDTRAGTQTIGYWWQQLQTNRGHRWKPSYRQRLHTLWNNQVAPRWDTTPVQRVDYGTVTDWLNNLAGSVSTRRQARVLLKQICDEAVRAQALAHNPVKQTDPPQTVATPGAAGDTYHLLDRTQIDELADTIAGVGVRHIRPSFGWLVRFAVYSMCRQGELFALERTDFDRAAGTVTINKSVRWVGGDAVVTAPKSASSRRTVTLSAAVTAMMAAHLDSHDGRLVWPSVAGTHLRAGSFRRNYWLPAVDQIGETGFKFHGLRHTGASLRMLNGESVETISRTMGHATTDITRRIYLHLYPEQAQAEADRASAFMFGE